MRESLPDLTKMALDHQLSSSEYRYGRCITLSGTAAEDHAGPIRKHSSLKDLTQNSLAIIQGTVTDIDQGFALDLPALLLEVQVDEQINDTVKYKGTNRVYFPYPRADFSVGGYRFCRENSTWPDPPKVGDEVILFPFRPPFDAEGQVFVPDPEGYEIILERKGSGEVVVPRCLKNDEDLIGVKDLRTIKKYTLEHLDEMRRPQPAGN